MEKTKNKLKERSERDNSGIFLMLSWNFEQVMSSSSRKIVKNCAIASGHHFLKKGFLVFLLSGTTDEGNFLNVSLIS